jgi:hypothetical protein
VSFTFPPALCAAAAQPTAGRRLRHGPPLTAARIVDGEIEALGINFAVFWKSSRAVEPALGLFWLFPW